MGDEYICEYRTCGTSMNVYRNKRYKKHKYISLQE